MFRLSGNVIRIPSLGREKGLHCLLALGGRLRLVLCPLGGGGPGHWRTDGRQPLLPRLRPAVLLTARPSTLLAGRLAALLLCFLFLLRRRRVIVWIQRQRCSTSASREGDYNA